MSIIFSFMRGIICGIMSSKYFSRSSMTAAQKAKACEDFHKFACKIGFFIPCGLYLFFALFLIPPLQNAMWQLEHFSS